METENIRINREHKDRLFRWIFNNKKDLLNLYEHQSSYNPNMPFREFLYLAEEYRKYVKQKDLNLYSSRLQKLPMPQCLVFYNGLKREPDRKELFLSDAFIQSERHSPCLELRVVMLNINWGHNRELMEKCGKLRKTGRIRPVYRPDPSGPVKGAGPPDSCKRRCGILHRSRYPERFVSPAQSGGDGYAAHGI